LVRSPGISWQEPAAAAAVALDAAAAVLDGP